MDRETKQPMGSSPLARGLLALSGGTEGRVWIIPARAGFTIKERDGELISKDHPRSRGVYSFVRRALV